MLIYERPLRDGQELRNWLLLRTDKNFSNFFIYGIFSLNLVLISVVIWFNLSCLLQLAFVDITQGSTLIKIEYT